jgi:glycosyltransferase involved in cell wall biosynthesis
MCIKLTILWSELASYNLAFFRELATVYSFRIQLIYQTVGTAAPYDSFDLSFCEVALEDSPQVRPYLAALVERFNPDAVLMATWNRLHFMRIARKLRRRGVYVVDATDNQWHGTIRQYLGILSSPLYLRPSIDTFLVPGDRQAVFARKLGYRDLLYGLYAAEVERFLSEVPITRRPCTFLFAGRLAWEKNIIALADAYRRYRERVGKPWSLRVAGVGPLSKELKAIPGIELMGFVQPADLPNVMNLARCLVIPSLLEPWGVVIQEAAAAGLPVIASHKCGAATAYVRSGINGFIVSPRVDEIAEAMVRVSQASEEELLVMSRASVQLASLWTPSKLAAYFHSRMSKRITSAQA